MTRSGREVARVTKHRHVDACWSACFPSKANSLTCSCLYRNRATPQHHQRQKDILWNMTGGKQGQKVACPHTSLLISLQIGLCLDCKTSDSVLWVSLFIIKREDITRNYFTWAWLGSVGIKAKRRNKWSTGCVYIALICFEMSQSFLQLTFIFLMSF